MPRRVTGDASESVGEPKIKGKSIITLAPFDRHVRQKIRFLPRNAGSGAGNAQLPFTVSDEGVSTVTEFES
jgi:hypothetical protein